MEITCTICTVELSYPLDSCVISLNSETVSYLPSVVEGDKVNPIVYGTDRTYSCSATGDPQPSQLQWRLNNRPIPSSNGVLR